MSCAVVEGDCLPVLAGMAAHSVDAVVTDPPWNLGKQYGAHDDAMPDRDYVDWLAAVLAECARVARGPLVFLPRHRRHAARRGGRRPRRGRHRARAALLRAHPPPARPRIAMAWLSAGLGAAVIAAVARDEPLLL